MKFANIRNKYSIQNQLVNELLQTNKTQTTPENSAEGVLRNINLYDDVDCPLIKRKQTRFSTNIAQIFTYVANSLLLIRKKVIIDHPQLLIREVVTIALTNFNQVAPPSP